MSDKETIKQLRAELMQMQLDANAVCQSLNIKWAQDGNYPDFTIRAIERLRGKWAHREWERDEIRAELVKTRTELTDACAARDALAQECNQLEANTKHNAQLVKEHDVELKKAHEYTRRMVGLVAERDVKLAQAHAELARLRRQLAIPAQRCGYCGYRYSAGTNETNFSVMAEHIKSCPAHPLSKSLVELAQVRAKLEDLRGANRALAQKAETQLAAAQKAADWLWGFWDGNTLVAKPGYEDDIREAWGKLLVAVDPADDTILERLAILDAAENVLADCGIAGIYDEFTGLTDAIEQMIQYINELTREDRRRTEQVKALQAERRLRQEAEQRAERLHREYTGTHEALDECGIPRDYDDGSTAAGRTRVFWLNQRTERAEALAQLVTPGLANLLVLLANAANFLLQDDSLAEDAKNARALAAKIREALDDSQA